MNQKWIRLFAAGALGCVLLFWLIPAGTAQGLMVLALPFTLIGSGLRALSLSGSIGNGAAIVIYILISLSPLLLKLKRKWQKEDWLLPLASAAVFYVLYYMINPSLRPIILNSDVGTLAYAGSVYSVFLTWGVVKLLRYCDSMGVSKIYQALRIFLIICAAECILVGFGTGFWEFRAGVAAVQEANTMPGLNLMPTYTFQFLAFAATALEYGLDALVMAFGVTLLNALEKDPYSEECYHAAENTAKWCKRALIIITLAGMVLNLGQMIFASSLRNIASQFRLPVLSMAIVFGMLALTRLLSQGKQLKEDNDLFI